MIDPSRKTIAPSARYLSEEERGVIADGRRANHSMQMIARELGRDPSTVSRELARNREQGHRYRPSAAHRMATARLARPRLREVATDPALAAVVQEKLDAKWSPEQISNSLPLIFPDDADRRLARESIYQALYAKWSVLQRGPATCLRSGRHRRRPNRRPDRRRANEASSAGSRRPISERPTEAEDRAVAGHWEGDLITGRADRSAIATLVERASGFTLLVHLPGPHTAQVSSVALTATFASLPPTLRGP